MKAKFIENADAIEATVEQFMEMQKSPDFVPVCWYPPITKYLDYEIGMFDGKRVIFDPFGHRKRGIEDEQL